MIEYLKGRPVSDFSHLALIDRDGEPVEPVAASSRKQLYEELVDQIVLPDYQSGDMDNWAADEIAGALERNDFKYAVGIWEEEIPDRKILVFTTKIVL
jgi:hypothetical protein